MDRQAEISSDLEQSLFAAVVLDPSIIDAVAEVTTGSHFRDKALGQAFDHAIDLYAGGIAIGDVQVLTTELRKAGKIEQIGGVSGVAKMVGSLAHVGHAIYHAQEIARLHRCRRLRSITSDVSEEANAPGASPVEMCARLEAAIQSLSGDGSLPVTSLSQAMDNLANQLESDLNRGEVSGVTTGIDSLDRITGGVMPGELVVIGARTSIGKTAFGMQMAQDAAASGHRTLVASLEMKELQLAQRIAASNLGLSLIDQRGGRLTSHDVARVREYAAENRETPLFIMDARRAKMNRIRGIAKSTKAGGGLGLLIVDYLQLIAPSDPRKPRYEQVTEVSNDLKSLAMELDIPVIALAQLNRQGESEKPKLSQLRESGAIEQDSDAVWFIHRSSRESRDALLIVAKQRQGITGEIPLRFDGEHCRFVEAPVDGTQSESGESFSSGSEEF